MQPVGQVPAGKRVADCSTWSAYQSPDSGTRQQTNDGDARLFNVQKGDRSDLEKRIGGAHDIHANAHLAAVEVVVASDDVSFPAPMRLESMVFASEKRR